MLSLGTHALTVISLQVLCQCPWRSKRSKGGPGTPCTCRSMNDLFAC